MREIERDVVRLYETHATSLFRYAGSLAENRDNAQDALQEVFLRYYIARSEGREIRNPKAWLYRVLRNHILDGLRSSACAGEVALEDAPPPLDMQADPEACYSQAELAALLRASLAPRELECVRLRGDGLRYEEIGEILEISPGTVGALLARAHKKIRRMLSGDDGMPEAAPMMVEANRYAS